MKRVFTLIICSGMLACASLAEDSQALLRSGTRVAITDISPAGITLATERGRPAKLESLSQVKSVSGPLAGKFDDNRSLATDLWRASARLGRDDEGGAEPLYEQLWVRTAGTSGPTRAEVAAGLAACRVHRGALATAIEPWTEWVRQSASLAPEQVVAQRARLGISDPTSNWIDVLPPVWTDSTAVRALAGQGLTTHAPSTAHPSGDDLFLIYAVAARRDTGQPWKIDLAQASKDPAWANLAGDMVLAECDNPEVRAESRQKLTARLTGDVPLWKQIWIRLAFGRSLLAESGADDRRAGVLNLLWIASRTSAPQPLVALALVGASRGLSLLGDMDGSRALLDDLERRFSGDVVLDSPGVASLRHTLAQMPPASPKTSPLPQSAPVPDKE
ncbi:MAG: hypothetical protein ACREJD_17175 [Phycisphaerales bacterium]